MIRSRYIFCALAIGLAVVGGSALDRACQGERGEDEAALPQIAAVDTARGVQAQPLDFGRTRAIALVGSSVDRGNCGLADRGVQWVAAGGRTLLSLHTLLME
jgi:hypothetical protein